MFNNSWPIHSNIKTKITELVLLNVNLQYRTLEKHRFKSFKIDCVHLKNYADTILYTNLLIKLKLKKSGNPK